MSSPFLLDEPALISFSGGRTSAYMLRRILDAGSFGNPDVHVVFANTGKERPETLDFVNEVETRWKIHIDWVEYERFHLPVYKSKERAKAAAQARAYSFREYESPRKGERGFRIVSYETASRNGEPFENVIDMVGLPSPTTRLCTQEMKIRPIEKRMRELGYTHWLNVVGIRADEPKRVARMRAQQMPYYENSLPLADAGITKIDVLKFWRESDFDLQLPLDENGDTYGGNCDLCFLKSTSKRLRIAKENPEWLDWWIEQEDRTGMVFLNHGKKFINLLDVTEAEACSVDDDLGDCVCHD